MDQNINFDKMDNSEKDIERYDQLENSQDVPDELKEVQDLDLWMKSLPLKEVGKNFTSTVIASAMLARKRHANFRILLWLMAFFAVLIAASFFMMGSGEPSMEPAFVDNLRNQSLEVLEMIADPRLRQLFLIIEGIICLVIIEKLVSSFRIIKHSAS